MTYFWKTSTSNKIGIYVSSKHKCATTFLQNLFANIALQANVSWDDELFDFIVYEHSDLKYLQTAFPNDTSRLLAWDRQNKIETNHNFCCACSRLFDIDIVSSIEVQDIYYVFQIRDPRDMLVSEYFSYAWNHFLTERSCATARTITMNIDQYCIESSNVLLSYFDKLLNHLKKLNPERIIIVTYEEMILSFKSWLNKVIRPFHFQNHDAVVDMLSSDQFIIKQITPPLVDQKAHIRHVSPGDHKLKLTNRTINFLTRKFLSTLKNKKIFNYEGYCYL